MALQNIFNILGLIVNMVGAYMMYHYTPKASSQVVLYTFAEAEQIRKKDLRTNKMIRLGMLLLFIGFILQFTALLIVG